MKTDAHKSALRAASRLRETRGDAYHVGHVTEVGAQIANELVPVLSWIEEVETLSDPRDRRDAERDAREAIEHLKQIAAALKGGKF
jgi:hypothetical protein